MADNPNPEPEIEPEDPELALSREDEKVAYQEAALSYLQERVIRLNYEIRIRDKSIIELNTRLRELQPE